MKWNPNQHHEKAILASCGGIFLGSNFLSFIQETIVFSSANPRKTTLVWPDLQYLGKDESEYSVENPNYSGATDLTSTWGRMTRVNFH